MTDEHFRLQQTDFSARRTALSSLSNAAVPQLSASIKRNTSGAKTTYNMLSNITAHTHREDTQNIVSLRKQNIQLWGCLNIGFQFSFTSYLCAFCVANETEEFITGSKTYIFFYQRSTYVFVFLAQGCVRLRTDTNGQLQFCTPFLLLQ